MIVSLFNAYSTVRALYNSHNVVHDNPFLNLLQCLPGGSHPTFSSPREAKHGADRAHVPISRPFTRSVEFFVYAERAGCGFSGLQSAAITCSLPGKPRRDDLRPLGNACCHGRLPVIILPYRTGRQRPPGESWRACLRDGVGGMCNFLASSKIIGVGD